MTHRPVAFLSRPDEAIRRATVGDLTTLSHIAHRAKRHWGYPSEWMRVWRPQLTVDKRDLASLAIFVADSGGRAVGFCAVAQRDAEWQLEHLWVLPEHMGRQIGRRLMERAIGYVTSHGGHRIRVESDPHAEGFYRRLGARRIGYIPAPVGNTDRVLPLLELSLT